MSFPGDASERTTTNAGDTRDGFQSLGQEDPEYENDKPLQYSCLGNLI